MNTRYAIMRLEDRVRDLETLLRITVARQKKVTADIQDIKDDKHEANMESKS
jgi:hypothetical protein